MFPRGSEWRKWDLHIHSKFSSEKDAKLEIKEIFRKAINEHIAVIAITDHTNVDGLDEVWRIWENESTTIDTSDIKISEKIMFFPGIELKTDKGKHGVHVVVLFPRFINGVKVKGTYLKNEFLSKINCSEEDIKTAGKGDYKRGLFEIAPKFEDVSKVAKQLGGLLVVHAGDKSRGIEKEMSHAKNNQDLHQIWNSLGSKKRSLMKSHIDICEIPNNKEKSLKEAEFYLKQFNKPTILGSDSHMKYGGDKFTWIKADPTFEGLRQIIYEPEERVKIQQLKPEEKDYYRVIEEIVINDEKNFPKKIVFNQNLSSIIGSRSSGKSALLSLVGYSIDSELVKERNEVIGLKDQYVKGYKWERAPKVSVKWKDGTVTKPFEKHTKSIYYIPQNYLFSGYDKTEDITKLIKPLLFSLDVVQQTEYQKLQSFLKIDEQHLKQQTSRLYIAEEDLKKNHNKIKEAGNKEEIEEALEKLDEKARVLQKNSKLSENDLNKYNKAIASIKTQSDEIETIKSDLKLLIQYSEEFDISFTSMPSGLGEDTLEKLTKTIDKYISKAKKSTIAILKRYVERMRIRKSKLKDNIKTINKANRGLFVKVKQAFELVKILEKKAKLEAKVKELKKLEKRNDRLSKSIENLLGSISQNIIEREKKIREYSISVKYSIDKSFSISSEVVIDETKVENICDTLNYRDSDPEIKKKYWKYDREQGRHRLKYQLFINEPTDLLSALLWGRIKTAKSTVPLKAFETLCEVISTPDFVANFEGDRIGGNKPSTMTPGKKALVALKLAIGSSQKKWPLLIDQPEDNLDSRSISKVVVDFLKEKKKERQIIMISHDANLVVCGDSEQVIVTNRKGSDRPNEDGKTFNYTSGSLEHSSITNKKVKDTLKQQGIREHVCDILEGGREAFEKRKSKYQFSLK